MAAPAGPAMFELERAKRIEENRKRMEDMGLLKQKSILDSYRVVKNPEPKAYKAMIRKAPVDARVLPRRASKRLQGDNPDYVEIDEHDRPIYEDVDELVDLMDRRGYRVAASQMIVPPEPSAEALEAIQAARCASQGRGSVYDSTAGITCHFCRQKKLCGEEGCQRCSERDTSKDCIGKTECVRCHGATGRFCRACLHIRYGQTLEEAREQMEKGEWLCPHCYEDEHPDEGWICNSSICMKRRGLKPTGIAIYDAQERGFKSVGHLLQAELRKRGPSAVLGGVSEEPEEDAAAGANNSSAVAAGTKAAEGPSSQAQNNSSKVVEEAAQLLGRGSRRGNARAATAEAPAQATQEAAAAPASTQAADEADVPLAARRGRKGRPSKSVATVAAPSPARPEGVTKPAPSKGGRSKRGAATPATTEATASQAVRPTRRSRK